MKKLLHQESCGCGCGCHEHAEHVHEHKHQHDHGHTHEHTHKHEHDHSAECGSSCGCGHAHMHDHGHSHGGCACCGEEPMDRREWIILACAAVLFLASFFAPEIPKLILLAAAYCIIGFPVLLHAVRGIFAGHPFDEEVLMAVATVGAIAIGDYAEAVAVMLFYRVGEAVQGLAVQRSRKRIGEAVALHPDHAHVLLDGSVVDMDPEAVAVGSLIRIGVGERIPLDGIVVEGESRLDCSGLTGESATVAVYVGSDVQAGSVNAVSALTVCTTALAEDSATGRLLSAIEDAAENKPKLERFITRFSRIYTPCVIAAAVLLAVLPPLLGFGAFSEWLRRALTFLVISCPCALVLSIPLTFFAGLGVSSKNGVLFKGADALESAARVKALVFDKTGTLTDGVFAVQKVVSDDLCEKTVLRLAAAAEADSPHPVATAIRAAADEIPSAENRQEHAGCGVSAVVEGKTVLVGNARLLEENGVECKPFAGILVAVDGVCVGGIEVSDRLRETAADAFREIKREKLYTAILTGDRKEAAMPIAAELGADAVYAGLLPEDKLQLIRSIRSEQGAALFLGDGINDAPVLAGADIGMAMAEHGTEMAAEAADALLLTEDLTRVPFAVRVGKRTVRVARENIALALGIKAAALLFAAFGIANMWIAVIADVGAALLCVMHALRVFRTE